MPRYFIDINADNLCHFDEDGCDLSGLQEAQKQAILVLPGIARDVLLDNVSLISQGHCNFVSTVKDEQGRSLFRATLALSTEFMKF